MLVFSDFRTLVTFPTPYRHQLSADAIKPYIAPAKSTGFFQLLRSPLIVLLHASSLPCYAMTLLRRAPFFPRFHSFCAMPFHHCDEKLRSQDGRMNSLLFSSLATPCRPCLTIRTSLKSTSYAIRSCGWSEAPTTAISPPPPSCGREKT